MQLLLYNKADKDIFIRPPGFIQCQNLAALMPKPSEKSVISLWIMTTPTSYGIYSLSINIFSRSKKAGVNSDCLSARVAVCRRARMIYKHTSQDYLNLGNCSGSLEVLRRR